jgi:hypothetical protein
MGLRCRDLFGWGLRECTLDWVALCILQRNWVALGVLLRDWITFGIFELGYCLRIRFNSRLSQRLRRSRWLQLSCSSLFWVNAHCLSRNSTGCLSSTCRASSLCPSLICWRCPLRLSSWSSLRLIKICLRWRIRKRLAILSYRSFSSVCSS